jgi:hypothetical protein
MKEFLLFLLLFTWLIQTSVAICSATVTCTGTCSCAGASNGASSGEISSSPYPNNADCRWLITTSSTNEIILKFSTLATELNYDYIYVDTCTSPSSCYGRIGTFTGNLQNIGLYTYPSKTGYLQMRLTSDESYFAGFVSSWSLVCPLESLLTTTVAPTSTQATTTVPATTPVPITTSVPATTTVPATTPLSTTTAQQCVPGTFKNVTGSGLCVSCDIGKYSNSTVSVKCIDCSTGMYAHTVGSTSCTFCPINSVNLNPYSNSSEDCVCAGGYEMINVTMTRSDRPET